MEVIHDRLVREDKIIKNSFEQYINDTLYYVFNNILFVQRSFLFCILSRVLNLCRVI